MEIAEESASQDEKVVTEWQLSVNERDEAIMALNNAYDTEYEKWTVAQAELIADQHKVEEWTTSIKARAIKQHREDSDALLRAEKAMGILKKFLQGLMVKVPSIEGVVRKMDDEGKDPYTAGNMRKCYGNMLEAYRKDDELGVATCIMTGMKLKQQPKQTLRAFVRQVEEFHQTLSVLGIQTITIADLAAMVAIGGMLEKHRSAFLLAESALALALDSLEESTEGEESGSTSSTSSRRRRALLTKVLAFVKTEETREQLGVGFGAQGEEVQGGECCGEGGGGTKVETSRST